MSPATDATSSYLRIFGAALATLLGLLALVNAAIDPYSLYDTPKIAGINDREVPPGDHLYALKTLASRRSSATALVLGSSRAEIGLDPAHPAWQGERCYNLAIPGADMALVRRYFEQLHRQRLVRKAVLALEFSMFDGKGRGVDDSAWAVQPSGAQNPAFYGRLVSILFSSDALLASARTVARSVLGGAHFYRDDGLRLWDSKQQKLERTGGHRPHFVRLIEAMQADHRALAGNLRYPLALDDFRMLLRIAHADRVDLRIVLSPEHAWLAEARAAFDPTGPAQVWLRDVVRINAEEAARTGHSPFPLWDFRGFSGPNLDPVPADGDSASRMRWYWEASHYKVELGDVVLARVLAGEPPGADVGAHFGALLDPANIDAHLAQDRLRRDAWARSEPDAVALIHSLVASPPGRSPRGRESGAESGTTPAER